MLYSAFVGRNLGSDSLIYLSVSKGLEAGGVAPNGAQNRNEVLPAILTHQKEVGYRTQQHGLNLVLSGFEIEKPYADFDVSSNYGIRGMVRHRGVEFSVAGEASSTLSVLAGLVLINGKVSGTGADGQFRSSWPLGLPSARGQLALEYATRWHLVDRVDISMNYRGPTQAKRDNSYRLPAAITVDLGMRRDFVAGGWPVQFRAQVQNALNQYVFNVGSDEGFSYAPGRSLRVSLTTQF